MGEKLPSFEITVGGREVSLEIGRCAVALFRTKQEVSYFAVDMDDDSTLRVFNNQRFAEWLAGYRIAEQDGEIHRPTTREDFNGAQMTFREITGWGPAIIEREEPNDKEIEMWTELNSDDLEDGLNELLGGGG